MRATPLSCAVTSLALLLTACGDRPVAPDPGAPRLETSAPAAGPREALAQALARALRSPALRARLKARLDGSPHREHKILLQRFVEEPDALAPDFVVAARNAMPLELYLPVPLHRAAWKGDGRLLVATALTDGDRPVAFDTAGIRYLLSATTPPSVPVLALVPAEANFSAAPAPTLMQCYVNCRGGGGGGGEMPPPPAPPPGLYMTQAHFTRSFEGWLKGSPEFEIHILGQSGQSDSLFDYQCAGEEKTGSYYFDQNTLDWSGSVMLFSKAQLDSYKTNHPGQHIRVYAVEDDDTACQIKTDPSEFQRAITVVDDLNRLLSAGIDSLQSFTYAKAVQSFLVAAASLVNTNDELVGNAVQDSVADEYHEGFNWVVKGSDNVTNGWIKLEMR